SLYTFSGTVREVDRMCLWIGLHRWLGLALTCPNVAGSTLRGKLRTPGSPAMATDTAATIAPRYPAPDPTRNAWQIPVFLVGAAVFASAWQGWLPLGTPDPAADFTHDLAALRNAYEKVTPDRDELKDQLAKVAAGVDLFPEQASFGRFILG